MKKLLFLSVFSVLLVSVQAQRYKHLMRGDSTARPSDFTTLGKWQKDSAFIKGLIISSASVSGTTTKTITLTQTNGGTITASFTDATGSGGSYTFSNGITETAGAVKLGGTISENTAFSGASFNTDWTVANFRVNGPLAVGYAFGSENLSSYKMDVNGWLRTQGISVPGTSATVELLPTTTGSNNPAFKLNGQDYGTNNVAGDITISNQGSQIFFGSGVVAGFTGMPVMTIRAFSATTTATVGNKNTAMQFGTDNKYRMGITAGGNVLIGTVTDNSLLTVNGSFALAYVAKTAAYTATAADHTIDCTTGTFTVTLPTAVGVSGRIYRIKNSGTGAITVGTTSSQTIDGATTFSLGTQYKYVSVQSNGANWIVIANN